MSRFKLLIVALSAMTPSLLAQSILVRAGRLLDVAAGSYRLDQGILIRNGFYSERWRANRSSRRRLSSISASVVRGLMVQVRRTVRPRNTVEVINA